MESFIVIRKFHKADKLLCCEELCRSSVMSNVLKAFYSCIFREITLQLIVLCAAVMFIFLGMPWTLCLLTIPGVIIFNFICIYMAYYSRATELGMLTIIYQNTQTTFPVTWIAEAFEPRLSMRDPTTVHYTVLDENHFQQHYDRTKLGKFQTKVVGTVSVTKHNALNNSSWICRLEVEQRYKNKGIAHAMIKEIIEYAKMHNLDSVEMTVTECQENARQMLTKMGFSLRQIYHKQIVGSALTILKYHFGFDTRHRP